MLDYSQDQESIARMLRAERKQLILAWEKLETEQRKLATIAGNPPPLREEEVRESTAAPVAKEHTPNLITQHPVKAAPIAAAQVGRKSTLASNTFRFLQREFDNKKKT